MEVDEALKGRRSVLGKPWKIAAAVSLGWSAEKPEPRPRRLLMRLRDF